MHRIIVFYKDADKTEAIYQEAADYFEVNAKELQLLCNWHFDRFTTLGDLNRVIFNPKLKEAPECQACKELAKERKAYIEDCKKKEIPCDLEPGGEPERLLLVGGQGLPPSMPPATPILVIPEEKTYWVCPEHGVKLEERQQIQAAWNMGEEAEAWWNGPVINEYHRYIDLRQPIIEHASKKLASHSFNYLCEIYEDRSVLLEELYEISWPAILVTSHREEAVESLKISKSYINTRIHHLAAGYTKGQAKQVWNEELGSYESMEIPLFSDPDMDPSKHMCLTYDESEYAMNELLVSMERHLTAKEFGVVTSLMRLKTDLAFEEFAKDQPDRRLAAFEFYEIHESELRRLLLPFLGMEAWKDSCFSLVG